MNDHDQAVVDAALFGSADPVHLAGAVRPFARCGSYRADERHTRNLAEVSCVSCMERMTDEELDQVG